jgi:hypothetical protein
MLLRSLAGRSGTSCRPYEVIQADLVQARFLTVGHPMAEVASSGDAPRAGHARAGSDDLLISLTPT